MKFSAGYILLIGPVPPPHHGVAVSTQAILGSSFVKDFNVIHLDTSDRRGLDNFGVLDFVNVSLAVKRIGRLFIYCLLKNLKVVYLPLSQNNLGFFRDACFIWIAKLFSKAKIIVHYHGSETFISFREKTNSFMRWLIPVTLRRTDILIVLGERLKHIFASDVNSVEVVYNGTILNPALRGSSRQAVPETIQVSFLGRLCRAKGVLDLLYAIPIVREKHPQAQFLFAGEWRAREPETQAEALHFIAEHKLESSVKFLGKVEGKDKEDFLLKTDIFTFPSWIDSFPMAILEAMAASCPVISTKDTGAIPEVVLDGKTGVLVEKKRPGQIAHAIIRLIENPNLRISMGTAGRKRVKQHFTIEQSAQKLRSIFEALLHEV